jgi:hypothetical protein
MSGLIIGYEINTRDDATIGEKSKKVASSLKGKTAPSTTLYMCIGLLVGVLIGVPTFLSSAKHNSALKQGDPAVIERTAYIWPYEPFRMIQVSSTLNSNKLESEGLKVALDAVERFPDNYAVWVNLNSMNSASEKQKAEALLQMKRLDPLNPNLK